MVSLPASSATNSAANRISKPILPFVLIVSGR